MIIQRDVENSAGDKVEVGIDAIVRPDESMGIQISFRRFNENDGVSTYSKFEVPEAVAEELSEAIMRTVDAVRRSHVYAEKPES